MQLTIMSVTGRKVNLEVEPEFTILQVKQAVQEKDGIDLVHIRLMFAGKPLQDEMKIKDYNITPGSKVQVFYNLRWDMVVTIDP